MKRFEVRVIGGILLIAAGILAVAGLPTEPQTGTVRRPARATPKY